MHACPQCHIPLDLVFHRDVELDHCRACGGTFLDALELAPAIGAPAALEHWLDSEWVVARKQSHRCCPKDGMPMQELTLQSPDQRVEVDVCPACRGVWLDEHECETLRTLVLRGEQKTSSLHAGHQGVRWYLFQLFSGLPLELWNPRHRVPVVTWTVLTTFCLIFLAQFLVSPDTYHSALNNGVFYPQDLLGGHAWSVVTALFFHGSWMHVIGNGVFLYVFGDNVEDAIGVRRFVVLYAASGLLGSLVHAVCYFQDNIPVLGASAAIAGVMGAYLALFPKVRLYAVVFFVRFKLRAYWYIGLWAAFNVLMLKYGERNVAWEAHLGGMAVGFALGLLWSPKTLARRFSKVARSS